VYEAFYGLSGKPFQLNPDPSFYFGSRQHRRAMAYLEYGLHQGEGFIVVTGDVGAGKTTIVRNLLSKLDPAEVVAGHLVSTQLDAEDTLRMVAAAFGLSAKDAPKSELLLTLEAFLVRQVHQNKRVLLVIDEAQNLTPRAVEELRMLSNFQLETHSLLQSFLVGQPEFRHTMRSPHMLQLRQRVIAACHIGPMDLDETRGYVEHRLTHVGWRGDPEFEADAYEALYRATGGIPRRINSVCDRVLLSGYLAGKHRFSPSDVNDVAREIMEETFAGPPDAAKKFSVVEPPADDARALPSDLEAELGRRIGAEALRMSGDGNAIGIEERLARLERQAATTLSLLQQILDGVRARGSRRNGTS
jgi:putative secretion ATPase (PEP-CTERM system associated)